MPYLKNGQWASSTTDYPQSRVKTVDNSVTCLLCGLTYESKPNIHEKGCPICTTKHKINHAW